MVPTRGPKDSIIWSDVMRSITGDFAVFERAAASELGAHGMVTGGPGEAVTVGGGNTGAHAGDTRARVTGDAAVGSGGGAGTAVADEGASSTAGRGVEAEAHHGGACDAAHRDMTDEGAVADGNAGARATAVGIGRASGDATDDRDGGGETAIVGEGARVVTTYAGGVTIDDTPAALAPAGGVTKKRRAKRSHTGQDARKFLGRAESLPAGRSGALGPPPPDGGDEDSLVA